MRTTDARFDVLGELTALRRYARALAQNEHDAEDLVQDTLLKAYAKRSLFDERRALRSWLLSILHNAFVDGVRSSTADRRRADQAASLAEPHFEPSQHHAVRLAGVLASFDRLPEEQRSALHLVAVEGMSYADAASVLGVPSGTLMSRLGRAREALRAMEQSGSPRSAQGLRIVGGADDLRQ